MEGLPNVRASHCIYQVKPFCDTEPTSSDNLTGRLFLLRELFGFPFILRGSASELSPRKLVCGFFRQRMLLRFNDCDYRTARAAKA